MIRWHCGRGRARVAPRDPGRQDHPPWSPDEGRRGSIGAFWKDTVNMGLYATRGKNISIVKIQCSLEVDGQTNADISYQMVTSNGAGPLDIFGLPY